MRALEKQVNLGEISYSRMIEIINEKADGLLSDKLLLAYIEIDELTNQLKQNLIKDIDRAKELEEINIAVTKLIKERDELTKEVDATFHELEGCREHVKQLQEEVERLRKEREWISVFRSDIKPPINTPILCKQKANDEKFTYLILGVDDNVEFRYFNTNDYIDSESELYSGGHYPYIEYWQPLPPISQ